MPNPQHISLQLHSVCSHLDYLILSTDDLVPKNKEKLKKYIHPPHSTVFYISDNKLVNIKLKYGDNKYTKAV